MPTNTDIHFSRVTKSSKKKKKDKKRGYVDAFRTTRDLSLKDTAPYVLFEFSVRMKQQWTRYSYLHMCIDRKSILQSSPMLAWER